MLNSMACVKKKKKKKKVFTLYLEKEFLKMFPTLTLNQFYKMTHITYRTRICFHV